MFDIFLLCSSFFLICRRPPRSTRTYPLFPNTTLSRSQAHLRARRASRADCIEAVLRTQLRRDVARAQRYADDAPIAVARGHRIVGVECLMRADRKSTRLNSSH